MLSQRVEAEYADEIGILCRATADQILNHTPIVGFLRNPGCVRAARKLIMLCPTLKGGGVCHE